MKQPFEKVIGIIGGGQLGKMLIESGLPWNMQYNVLDPDPSASCKDYAKTFINAGLTDGEAIKELAKISDVLTYEIEHVNTEALLELESQGKTIIPSPSILKIIQDKGLQKKFYTDNGLPTAKYRLVAEKEDWVEVLNILEGEKIVAKLCKGGYDGKGVSICNKTDIVNGIFPFDGPCVLEEFIANCREIAILVASNGIETLTWPSIEMNFDPKLNLVDYLFSPGNLDKATEQKASETAIAAVKALNGKGVFAVELFITPQGDVLINEIAPRPHNSGHHTIEACITSQYEQLNRILLDLPLGNTDLIKPAVMVNIIGPENSTGNYKLEGLDKAMQIPGFYLHLYKKNETRPGRKMGHYTVLAETTEEAIIKALEIKEILKITSV
ncbi:MAG: 5-(carboxyamino)imidazole ribonucleotide synthase [Bacteroidia bacterium]